MKRLILSIAIAVFVFSVFYFLVQEDIISFQNERIVDLIGKNIDKEKILEATTFSSALYRFFDIETRKIGIILDKVNVKKIIEDTGNKKNAGVLYNYIGSNQYCNGLRIIDKNGTILFSTFENETTGSKLEGDQYSSVNLSTEKRVILDPLLRSFVFSRKVSVENGSYYFLFYYNEDVLDRVFKDIGNIEYNGFLATTNGVIIINFPPVGIEDEKNVSELSKYVKRKSSGAVRVRSEEYDKTIYFKRLPPPHDDWSVALTFDTESFKITGIGKIILIVQALVLFSVLIYLLLNLRSRGRREISEYGEKISLEKIKPEEKPHPVQEFKPYGITTPEVTTGDKKTQPAETGEVLEKEEIIGEEVGRVLDVDEKMPGTVTEVGEEKERVVEEGSEGFPVEEEIFEDLVPLDEVEEVEEIEEIGEAEVAESFEPSEDQEEKTEGKKVDEAVVREEEPVEAASEELFGVRDEHGKSESKLDEGVLIEETGEGESLIEEEIQEASGRIKEGLIEPVEIDEIPGEEKLPPLEELVKAEEEAPSPGEVSVGKEISDEESVGLPETQEPGEGEGIIEIEPEIYEKGKKEEKKDEIASLIKEIEEGKKPPQPSEEIIERVMKKFIEEEKLSRCAYLGRRNDAFVPFVTVGLSGQTVKKLKFEPEEKVVKRYLKEGKILHITEDVFYSEELRDKFDHGDKSKIKQVFLIPIMKEGELKGIIILPLTHSEVAIKTINITKIKKLQKDVGKFI